MWQTLGKSILEDTHHLLIVGYGRSEVRSQDGGGAWVAQLLKRPTLAQVMISQLVSSSPASGSVLTAWSLFGFCVSLSLTLPGSRSVSLSKANKH